MGGWLVGGWLVGWMVGGWLVGGWGGGEEWLMLTDPRYDCEMF